MVQVRSRRPARGGGAAQQLDLRSRHCRYCNARVVFMRTYIAGALLCFDAVPVPRHEDREQVGWLPGVFLVDDERQVVFAPLKAHTVAGKRTATHVMMLHVCPSMTSQDVQS